jgi:hypothetical protein
MKSIDLAMGRSGLLLAYKNIESSNSHTSQINEIVNYITSGKHDNFAQTVGYDFLGGESGVLFALSRVLTETTYRITPDFENWMRNRTDVMLERLKRLACTSWDGTWNIRLDFSLSHIYRTGILTGIEQKLIETVVRNSLIIKIGIFIPKRDGLICEVEKYLMEIITSLIGVVVQQALAWQGYRCYSLSTP